MSHSLEDVQVGIGQLEQRVDGANGIVHHLERAASYLSEARDLLRQSDDKAAAAALDQVSSCLDHLRNAHYGWLNDFVATIRELSSRIARN
ncbi:MAG: hypothetical protein Q4B08_11770 [Propionibacteriaceae bacterium]|nr:hypothetical protein [Propionibacteriaceae bacterium]